MDEKQVLILEAKARSPFSICLPRDHPFKTSAFFRGGGVQNSPNLPTDSIKKLPTVGG